MPTATTTPSESLLTPRDHTLLLVDHQPQMAFATSSIDAIELRNNVALIAHAARAFGVATILATVAERTFSGPLFDEIREALPGVEVTDRTNMNAWEDQAVIDRVNGTRKSRVVMAGLWTSVCIVNPALSALEQGFDVYVVSDACGDVSTEAHERAMTRMIQAGVRPMTSLQYLLELQRDWARSETYDAVVGIAKAYGGAYGLGLIYAKSMLGQHAGEGASAALVGA
jgi:nicotinamidase-related amidase